jgi:YcxB-like protein
VTAPSAIQSIDVKFDYKPWENYRAQRAIARRAGNPSLWVFLGVVFSILGVAIMLTHPNDPRASFLRLWFVFVFPSVAFVFVPVSQIFVAFRHWHPTMPHTDCTVTLSPSGVSVACAAVKTESLWQTLLRVEETKEFFLFYLARNRAICLPKRCLASPDDIGRVRDTVRAYAPDKAEF